MDLVRDGLQPFVGRALTGDLHGQMREPAVRSRAVPVLHADRNVHHVAGVQLRRRLALLLIVAAPGHTDQNLTAALRGVVISGFSGTVTLVEAG